MERQNYARYKTTMLVAAGLFAVWGVFGIFDVDNQPYAGYLTDGDNTVTVNHRAGPAGKFNRILGNRFEYYRQTNQLKADEVNGLNLSE